MNNKNSISKGKLLILPLCIIAFMIYQQSYTQIPPIPEKNHFKTWFIEPSISVNYRVLVEDQFMSDSLFLTSIDYLSNPTVKIHGSIFYPIIDSTHHLTWYKATGNWGNVKVRYTNQFETNRVNSLGEPAYLLLPTQKLPHMPPNNLDYYKAYRFIKPSKIRAASFQLHDQFDSTYLPEDIDSIVATYFLTPASFNKSRVFDSLTHYVAYEIFPKRIIQKNVNTFDVFGPHILYIDHSHYVLAPTTKITTVKIEGNKFHDFNGNGIRDENDIGLEGWKIMMQGVQTPYYAVTYTDNTGKYSFPEAPPGRYIISEELKPGWLQTYPLPNGYYDLNLLPGAYYDDIDFGNCRDSARIYGFKYNDINGNGVREETEPPLGDWEIVLINENTGEIKNTQTNEFGFFEFKHLLPGEYTLKEVLKEGWRATAPPGIAEPGISIILETDLSEYSIEILNFKLAKVTGVKFFDHDRNGERDPEDEGLSGWLIELINEGQQISRYTWTNENGEYEFTDVEPGNYTICEQIQPNWIPTCEPCFEFEVSSGEVVEYNFCNFLPHDCPTWIKAYDKPKVEDMGFEIPTPAKKMTRNLVVRDSGDYYICGYSNSPWDEPTPVRTKFDYVTIKYDEYGNEIWAKRYNNPDANGDDKAYSLTTDPEGNVYVTGESFGGSSTKMDIATIKYNSTGEVIWITRWTNPIHIGRDAGYAIAVDPKRNIVFVTGETFNGKANNIDYITIAYDANSGAILWTAMYNGPGSGVDKAYAISLNFVGNPVVTGESKGTDTGPDYATIMYNGFTGLQLWVARYDAAQKQDYAFDVEARSKAGYVFVTGASKGSNTGFDYATIKYDQLGNQIWVSRYHNMKNDYGYDLVLFGVDNIAVTGASEGSATGRTGLDYATIRYEPDGTQSWVNRLVYPRNDIARSISYCENAFFVTGSSDQGTDRKLDYVTQKINALDGSEIWVGKYNRTVLSDDIAYNVRNRLDNCCVVLTGTSKSKPTSFDFVTIQGSANGPVPWSINTPIVFDEEEVVSVFNLHQNYPNPFNPKTYIKFDLPEPAIITLKIYNLLGQEVLTLLDNELMSEGNQEVELDATNFASGVYFYRIDVFTINEDKQKTNNFYAIKKMLLLK